MSQDLIWLKLAYGPSPNGGDGSNIAVTASDSKSGWTLKISRKNSTIIRVNRLKFYVLNFIKSYLNCKMEYLKYNKPNVESTGKLT